MFLPPLLLLPLTPTLESAIDWPGDQTSAPGTQPESSSHTAVFILQYLAYSMKNTLPTHSQTQSRTQKGSPSEHK